VTANLLQVHAHRVAGAGEVAQFIEDLLEGTPRFGLDLGDLFILSDVWDFRLALIVVPRRLGDCISKIVWLTSAVSLLGIIRIGF
jgi:hypothetical protein